ncbi:MAG: hypothetical protein EHM77_09025 [Planctomycetaceae bacterium]|nr:MAG: hypothetical protein EHM77_09025 [Planctomycetaceae bacterium]
MNFMPRDTCPGPDSSRRSLARAVVSNLLVDRDSVRRDATGCRRGSARTLRLRRAFFGELPVHDGKSNDRPQSVAFDEGEGQEHRPETPARW